MRPVILIVGIIIIIAGVVLLTVPLTQSGTKTIDATTPAHFHVTERVPVESSQPVTATWSSSSSVTLVIRTCSSINLSAPQWAQCTGGSNLTETGSSGSASTSVPVGGYLWVVLLVPAGAGNLSATVSVTTTLSTEALGLFGLGALVIIVGLLLKRRPKTSAPASAAPAAAGTSAAAPESPTAVSDESPSGPTMPPELPVEEPLL